MLVTGRPRDDCWLHVTKLGNGRWKCNYCAKVFSGGAARIKVHLGTEKGKGIALCHNYERTAGPSNPLEVVTGMNSSEVVGHAHYTIHDNIPNSSNHQDVTPPIYPFEETGAAPEMISAYTDGGWNHPYDTGAISTSQGLANIDDVMGSGNGGFESEISKIKELSDLLTREKVDIERELEWLESRTGKRKRDDQIDKWLEETEELEDKALEMIESLGQGSPTGRSALEAKIKELIAVLQTHTEGKPLVLSNELIVGGTFNYNFSQLERLVSDDEVLIIGMHGMGGVGKTTLVTHFMNRITRDRVSKHVFWITVSRDFSIFKLQSGIAKKIGIKLDEDDDIIERAKILSSALQKIHKWAVILDDVWNYIDLQKVGIPLRVNGNKLILISRLQYVFRQMDCLPDDIIRIEPLSPDSKDAWELFLLKLGCYGTPATLTHEVEQIATSIVNLCDGLPLAISVTARTMKGVTDICRWRHVLKKFENSGMGKEMEEDVFKVLKLSYDHLMDKNIQDCFLRCVLYSEVSPNILIMNLVEEGLIKEMKSLEEMFDEGYAILDKLEGHSLLLARAYSPFSGMNRHSYLRINGMVREMAYHIMNGRYMVKHSKRLTKILDMQEWVPSLDKISLMGYDAEEIPADTSPRCPQLSTLIFSHNKFSQMPNCFFNHMNALTMLDLSHNKELTSLPNSLSSLRSLKSLLLEKCSSLKYVPPLEELQELSRLVISETSIEQVPSGLAMLAKLKWLDLSWNEELTSIPGSVLSGLTNIQYLDVRRTYDVTVELESVRGMSKLEYFSGDLQVGKNLADYVENILDRGSGPKYYNLVMGIGFGEGEVEFYGKDKEDRHYMEFGDCEAFDNLLLPRDLDRLWISKNKQWSRRICDALSFKAPSSLRRIRVEYCPKLERLLCLSGSCSFCKHLQNLQYLSLYNLERLEDAIWKGNGEGMRLPNLSHLVIEKCHGMEKLLTPLSLQQLPNLEKIEVWECNSMKEVFAVRSSEDDNLDSTITLPDSFEELKLGCLPQLKFVCEKIIVSKFLPRRDVYRCPNLIKGSFRHKSSHFDSEPVVLW